MSERTEGIGSPLDVEFEEPRGPIRWRRWLGLSVPLAIALVFVLAGALADVLAPHDPSFVNLGARLEPPVFDGGTWEHPLGTDDVGRDILSRLMHGARLSLIVVGIVVPGSALFGTLVGMTSGWKGGATGQILMRIVDIQLALPGILFALLLGSIFGPSLRNVIIILLVWTWSSYARLVRAEVLSLRERDFTTASRALGGGRLVDHAQAPVPQRGEHGGDHHDAGGGDRDPGGGGVELPRRGRPGGHGLVGSDDHGGP